MTKRRHKGGGSARGLLSRAIALVGESHALSYALVMALASTPRERFSHKEIDALCQVAYELHRSLVAASKIQRLVHPSPRRLHGKSCADEQQHARRRHQQPQSVSPALRSGPFDVSHSASLPVPALGA
jgi:hypothetical protein